MHTVRLVRMADRCQATPGVDAVSLFDDDFATIRSYCGGCNRPLPHEAGWCYECVEQAECALVRAESAYLRRHNAYRLVGKANAYWARSGAGG